MSFGIGWLGFFFPEVELLYFLLSCAIWIFIGVEFEWFKRDKENCPIHNM